MAASKPTNPLLSAWFETLSLYGDEPAVIHSDGEVYQTFEELNVASDEWAGEFESIPAGMVVGFQTGNCLDWPALFLALVKCDLVVLPLEGTVSQEERDTILESCGAAVLLTLEEGRVIASELKNDPVIWPDERPNFLKLTSGTTAAPRLIRFRWEHLVADCDIVCDSMGISSEDVNFGVIPFSHSYGFSNLITPLLCRGVGLVVATDRMPRAITIGLQESGATVFPGMPVFYAAICRIGDAGELPGLRLCISAGAALPVEVVQQFHEKFGKKIHTFYGSSECGAIAYDGGEAIVERPGYVGTAMRGVEHIAVQGWEKELGTQIEIRSAAVGDGYYPVSQPGFLSPGRFIPGDILKMEDEGLFIIGRASDIINVAGKKVNPELVEACLHRHSSVRQAVVFGVSSDTRNEDVIACVESEGKIDRKELLHHCRGHLASWQVPRVIWIVNRIPVNERGKVSRKSLASTYATVKA